MKHFTINAENNITVHASRKSARETENAGVFSTEAQFADLIGNDNKRLLDIWNSLPGVKPVTKFANRKAATERIWKAIQNLGGRAANEPASEPEAGATTLDAPPTDTPSVEPVSATPEGEPPVEVAASDATSEPVADQPEAVPESETKQDTSAPAAEQQLVSEPAPSQPQEPSVAPVEAAQQTTPFDEPLATVGAQGADDATLTPAATKKASRAKKAPTGETSASVPREGSKTSRVIAMLKREGGTTVEEIMAEMGWLKHTTRAMLSAGGALAKKHGLVVTSQKVGDQRTYFIKA
jgi:hypothetical protein